MRILIVSDTHGHINRVKEVYEKLNPELSFDVLVHCGDYLTDAYELESEFRIKLAACNGNCDGYRLGHPEEILETEYGMFLVTHGHEYYVNYSLDELAERAEELGCAGVFFGHTHKAVFVKHNGIIFMNPGSIERPRDNSGGTFGIMEITEDSVKGKIIRYDDLD